ncbi:MBL fold metallo-hydrolase [Azorhizobium oxalatiphilum]|uniref:MBL fold metallo-hydrolase n=1 Tax=Azorhizobium oxalatiphilum TaxID=980631 RepID=A0A917CDI1_9HYPH|nr:MBL fold metallo-hydrolase [Azorhizobium oxalatiphilum]GGF85257.1 MBL fold metallo-hydrolase [Azorhizobium oxalatiphilum]
MPPLRPLPPAAYRYTVSSVPVTAVPDGARSFPLPAGFVVNQPHEAVKAALREAFLPDDTLTLYFNPLLLEIAGKRVLIDTGYGPQAEHASFGRLHHTLESVGIAAATIDTVVISHFHGDHINGLLAADGSAAFPNAHVLVPEPEWAFWMDEGAASRAADPLKAAFANVRRVFGALGREPARYGWDKEIVPGLTAIGTPGHTPGHTSFLLESDGQKLFIQSDLTNTPFLFVRNPGWHAMFDMDPQLAEQNRRKMLGMVAAERMLVAGFHFPFPGAAHLEKDGDGFRYVPVPWVQA